MSSDELVTEALVLQKLQQAGVIRKGHFRLNTGNHSDTYISKDDLTCDTGAVDFFAMLLAQQFMNNRIDTVVGSAYGAIVLSHLVARHLRYFGNLVVTPVFAVKTVDGFEIRSTMVKHVRGRRVLVVEDVLTTGRSARKTIEAVRNAGGVVFAVAALCNRGNVTRSDLGLHEGSGLSALANLSHLKTYSPELCPQCETGVPVDPEYGHGGKK
jgi:orotate phosphoribosyltransferase